MAMKSNHAPSPKSFKKEKKTPSTFPPSSQLLETASVTGEPRELKSIVPSKHQDQFAASTVPSSFSLEKENQDGREPKFMKSVNELFSLTTALNAFKDRWDELQKHVDSVQNSIVTYSRDLGLSQIPIVPVTEAPTSNIPNSGDDATKQRSKSELESLCQMMSNRGLRKYVLSNLSDLSKLREEVPLALKSAPQPAKLVLDCIGRFYLQGSKAYSKCSTLTESRNVSILILEFFLLTGCTEIEPPVKEEAETAAISWRKRLINESSISKASDMDARGLLLFIGSFGIPAVFKNEDIRNLIRLSHPREILDALRKSHVLLKRIRGLIADAMKDGMRVEAVNLSCTFGVEDKFPPQLILSSFVNESRETWKKVKSDYWTTPSVLKEAHKKYLDILKSVLNSLEYHNINPSEPISVQKIKEEITSLEKEISQIEKKIEDDKAAISKRRADEQFQEAKRSRLSPQLLHPTRVIPYEDHPGHINNSYHHMLGTSSLGVVDRVSQMNDPYGRMMAEDPARLAGQRFATQPASMSLYGPTPRESLVGLSYPSSSGANRSSGSDLYQFADTIMEGESYYNSDARKGAAVSSVASARRSSYLY